MLRPVPILLLALSLGGCTVAAPTTPPAAGLRLLPGDAAPPRAAWYESRLDGGPAVLAGVSGPTLETSVTRTRGGLRVSLDGRVRDTLSRRGWSESVRTGVR